jgi:lipopolysaccharide/colanic/teichoic acid biosynthesis glycosyltransferase
MQAQNYHSHNSSAEPSMNPITVPVRGLQTHQCVVKRIEDLLLSLLLIFLIGPLMIVIAVAIRLDSFGPVLFWQWRRGLQGKLIRVYKFRSMYNDLEDKACKQQTTPHDPRVTPVGRFLRRHSLDELPQLFNVLRGDMSLVGPRPHALETSVNGQPLECITEAYRYRYGIKPGITGWAQVNGWRGQLNTIEKVVRRVEHDLHYIQNWSLILDLKILTRSVACTLGDEAAF